MPKPVCENCGKDLPIVGKGLCRKCYDKTRLIVVLNVNKNISHKVKEFAESKRWSMPYTLNYLTKCGIKWVQRAESLKKELEL